MSVSVEQPIVILDPSLAYRPEFKTEEKYRNFNKDEVLFVLFVPNILLIVLNELKGRNSKNGFQYL